jgi:phage portal protein BeeE
VRLPRWLGGQKRDFQGIPWTGAAPSRGSGALRGAVVVNEDTALRHSAVWACLRLRADLMASFPCGVYRNVDGVPVEWPKPPVLVAPGGKRWDYRHWMWATQHDLDSCGNTIGLITEVNALGLPARIDLQPIRSCSVIQRRGMIEPIYKIDGHEYPADKVWHERQFPVAGLPVGLSPLVYAAWSIGEYLSEQQFGLDWFGGMAVPKARMKNKAKVLKPDEINVAKQWYRDVVQNGDLLVHGNDWEYDFIQAQEAGMAWIEARKFGLADVGRYLGVPADLIDAAISGGGTITYQTTQQRNLQFLIMNMAPATAWRETALSTLLPSPRYVKLNTNVLLRMDPATQATVLHQRIEDRTLTVTEARALYELPPLTDAQIAEFALLNGGAEKTHAMKLAETTQKIYLGVGTVLTADEARTILNEDGAGLPVPGPFDETAKAPAPVAPAQDVANVVRDTLEQWVSGTAPTSPAPIGGHHD